MVFGQSFPDPAGLSVWWFWTYSLSSEEYYQALAGWWLLIGGALLFHLAKSATDTILYKPWDCRWISIALFSCYHNLSCFILLISWVLLIHLARYTTATMLYKCWDFSQVLVSLPLIFQVIQTDTSGSLVSIMEYTVTSNWLMAADQLSPSALPGKIYHCYRPL